MSDGFWTELIAEGMWSYRWHTPEMGSDWQGYPIYQAVNVREHDVREVQRLISEQGLEEPDRVAAAIVAFYDDGLGHETQSAESVPDPRAETQ